MFGIEAVVECMGIIEEERQFNEMCKALPADVANKLKADRSARRKEEIAHNRALEVADAGRARNFWGN